MLLVHSWFTSEDWLLIIFEMISGFLIINVVNYIMIFADWGKRSTVVRWTKATDCNCKSRHTKPRHSSPRWGNKCSRFWIWKTCPKCTRSSLHGQNNTGSFTVQFLCQNFDYFDLVPILKAKFVSGFNRKDLGLSDPIRVSVFKSHT